MKKITQSIIKSAISYNEGSCGGEIMASLNKIQRKPSPAMLLGIYFEYLVTGSTGLTEEIPQPVTLKNGDLSAPYRTCVSQAERVKELLNKMNIKILEVGSYHERDDIGGHFDIIASVDGVRSIIDIKYSANADDKWSPWGWGWNDKQKEFHSIQAAHYSKIFNHQLPFYYLVTEASDNGRIDFYKIDLTDDLIKRHDLRIQLAKDMLDLAEFGLEYRPEYNRCEGCPVKEECQFRMFAPKPKTIVI